MGLKTFKGGVHPYEGKELAKDAPIVEVLPKGDLVYPLSQHIGAPATPVVSVGDQVAKGQLIGEPKDGLSVAIHCSIDGVVQKVTDREVVVKGK
jgi:electron transport complex protein RnfC